MDIHVVGHDYESDFKDLNDLSWWIQKKVIGPIMKKMSNEEKQSFKHDPIAPDGSSFSSTSGNLNVYTGMFPPKWRPRILGGISWFLQGEKIPTGTWTTDISGFFKGEQVVRIPIKSLPTKQEPGVNLGLSTSTVMKIRDLLEIGLPYGEDDNFSIHADTLLSKIESYSDEVQQGLAPEPDLKIKHFIETLRQMAEWAIKHGYTEIAGA